jgi:ATP-binding cassette, subfamily G (WHITE), member 2, PDR
MESSMISSKLEERIVKIEPTHSGSSSRDSIKITDAGLRSEMKQIDALPSKTMVQNGQVNVDKRTELTRVATELHRVEVEDPALDPTSPESTCMDGPTRRRQSRPQVPASFFHVKNLIVSGTGSTAQFQTNVGSIFMAPFRLHEYFSSGKKPRTTILKHFDGITKSGELLLVLGRPGSGCSTLLKTIAGELHGLMIDKDSMIHYNGIVSQKNI